MLLGALVDEKLTVSQQCVAATEKEKLILGCICRNIISSGRDVIIPLYSVLARLHMKDAERLKQTAKAAHENNQRAEKSLL